MKVLRGPLFTTSEPYCYQGIYMFNLTSICVGSLSKLLVVCGEV